MQKERGGGVISNEMERQRRREREIQREREVISNEKVGI